MATLEEVAVKAMTLFGSEEAAGAWFNAPAVAFGWNKPAEVMATKEGVQLVHDLLTRLEYGVFT